MNRNGVAGFNILDDNFSRDASEVALEKRLGRPIKKNVFKEVARGAMAMPMFRTVEGFYGQTFEPPTNVRLTVLPEYGHLLFQWNSSVGVSDFTWKTTIRTDLGNSVLNWTTDFGGAFDFRDSVGGHKYKLTDSSMHMILNVRPGMKTENIFTTIQQGSGGIIQSNFVSIDPLSPEQKIQLAELSRQSYLAPFVPPVITNVGIPNSADMSRLAYSIQNPHPHLRYEVVMSDSNGNEVHRYDTNNDSHRQNELFVNGLSHNSKYDIKFYARRIKADGTLGETSAPFTLPVCENVGIKEDLGCSAKPDDPKLGYRRKKIVRNNYLSLTGECLPLEDIYICDSTCPGYADVNNYADVNGCSVPPLNPILRVPVTNVKVLLYEETEALIQWGNRYIYGMTYVVTANPGGQTVESGLNRIDETIRGLTPGTTYTFTVSPKLDGVVGFPSAPTTPITTKGLKPPGPSPVPAIVSDLIAEVDYSQVGSIALSWTAPAAGTSPITSYTIRANPGEITKTVTAATSGEVPTNTIFTGLNPGTRYRFTITATNTNGAGPPSTQSSLVTTTGIRPSSPPGPVIYLASERNLGQDGSYSLLWTAPIDEYLPITSYIITATPGGTTKTVSADTSGEAPTNTIFTGLTPGTNYTFTITATNSVGTGPSSSESIFLASTPVPGAPGRPTNIQVWARQETGTVNLTWTAPNSPHPWVEYIIIAYGGPGNIKIQNFRENLNAGYPSAIFTGLTPGTQYRFTITARNTIGTGLPGKSSVVTTSGVRPSLPPRPVIYLASERNLDQVGSYYLLWTPPFDVSLEIISYTITSYTITATPGGTTKTVSADTSGEVPTNTIFTGLTPGTNYTFTITATNSAGTVASSSESTSLSEFIWLLATSLPGAPEAPDNIVVSAGQETGTVNLTWRAPNSPHPWVEYIIIAYGGPSNIKIKSFKGDSVFNTGNPNVIFTGLTPGTQYRFTIIARNSIGFGAPSSQSNPAIPTAAAAKTIPGAPTGLTATVDSDKKVSLAWVAPTNLGGDTSVNYNVTICSDVSCNNILNTFNNITATSYTTTVLAAGTYNFRISASNSEKTSSYLAASATIPAATAAASSTSGSAASGSAASGSAASGSAASGSAASGSAASGSAAGSSTTGSSTTGSSTTGSSTTGSSTTGSAATGSSASGSSITGSSMTGGLPGTDTTPAPVITPPVITPPVTPAAEVITPPVITPPVPVITPPAPVITPPAPVITPPAPVITPPVPVITLPVPVITPPAPVITPPAPVITPPDPVITPPAPAPVTTGGLPGMNTQPNTYSTVENSANVQQDISGVKLEKGRDITKQLNLSVKLPDYDNNQILLLLLITLALGAIFMALFSSYSPISLRNPNVY